MNENKKDIVEYVQEDTQTHQSTQIRERSNSNDVIHEDMSTYDITKNVAKGSWILGKRFMQKAKETMEEMKDKMEKAKEERSK